jgi:hypothetical protein
MKSGSSAANDGRSSSRKSASAYPGGANSRPYRMASSTSFASKPARTPVGWCAVGSVSGESGSGVGGEGGEEVGGVDQVEVGWVQQMGMQGVDLGA